MDKATAKSVVQWIQESGVQRELVDFAYLFVRSALNRILLGEPEQEIYADPKATRHDLLGHASAICILDAVRKPSHRSCQWPEQKVVEVTARALAVYAQLLRFIAGMIDKQDHSRRSILAPFRDTITVLAEQDNIEISPSAK